MGVYYYIVNRTLKERIKKHYGKWGVFDFDDVVQYLCSHQEGWSNAHDIWAVGDDYSNAVKYFPCEGLTDDEMKEAMNEYAEV
ncbi:hypothetical protein HA402_013667 [Bradysia odoriphaga]|nr:hypothetical protein HA402_013667 [Bradysia odoriphaga]